ncbi:MAG TPA: serine/threonine-protein kinase [Gemmataceae bacterium]|jgi:serine/threonine-protein kinase|nr:serine/threonine-protein kinase [Gemmataceae bacterium]
MHDATQPVTPNPTSGAPPTGAPAPDLTGHTIGDFRIIRRLGQGGMGSVYLAEQRSLKRRVALKFLHPNLAANPKAVSRFRREAEAVARVTHANIVQVYFINAEVAPYFMALEYVEGRNLREYLSRKGRLDLPIALTIMRQVAAALQRAAESEIVHRDIKPENILLTRKGEVKVADFGLSRVLAGEQDLSLTDEGTTMGTPLYMSPEQAQGKSLDARSDIYSFGVTCFHILAGQPPFRGQAAIEVALKHVNEKPPSLTDLRADLPPWLVSLVHRMISKDPAQRPQTGRDVLRELSQATAAGSGENPFAGLVVAPSDETLPLPVVVEPRASSRRRIAVGTLAVLLAGAAGVGLRLMVNARSVPPDRDDHPKLPVVGDQERRLAAAVELYTNPPPKSPDKIRQGAGHCVQLGILYWDQRRYDDAERFFDELGKKPGAPPIYRIVSILGLAVTDSLKDEVDRSNKLFLDARNSAKPVIPPASMPADDAVSLRYWIVTALDRNATRPPVPKELEEMRRELRFRPNMMGGGKAQ